MALKFTLSSGGKEEFNVLHKLQQARCRPPRAAISRHAPPAADAMAPRSLRQFTL